MDIGGRSLSASLFNIIVDSVLKELDLSGKRFLSLKLKTLYYKDDILLLAGTKQLINQSIQLVLIMNTQRTKYLRYILGKSNLHGLITEDEK